MKKNVYAIIDGQAGSCGKGKVIGQFALDHDVDVAIANCLPNAGHTVVKDGKQRVFHNIPVSAINLDTKLFIGAGSAIDMNVLAKEYAENEDILRNREIIVHPLVPLIEERHILKEQQNIRSGSTFKGGGACLAEKIMRYSELKFFKEFENIKVRENYHEILLKSLKEARKVLLEGSQGCDLDLNHSRHYPYVTSRSVGVSQMLSDSGISPKSLQQVIMVIRPFPIRISNTTNIQKKIYSGDYGNSQELSWEKINIAAYFEQYPTVVLEGQLDDQANLLIHDFTELTTVTKQKRRVFDIDINQLKQNIAINTPDYIYLNFFQHLGLEYADMQGHFDELYIHKHAREYVNWLEEELAVPIDYLGTGADYKAYVKRKR